MVWSQSQISESITVQINTKNKLSNMLKCNVIQNQWEGKLVQLHSYIIIDLGGEPTKVRVESLQGKDNQPLSCALISNETIMDIIDQKQKEEEAQTNYTNRYKEEWKFNVNQDAPGLEKALDFIIENLVEFLSLGKQQSSYTRRSSGILIYGPSGSGKSFLIQSIAKHSGLPYKIISGPFFFQQNQGKSEEMIHKVYKELLTNQKGLLILEEFDIICGQYEEQKDVEDRIKSAVLDLLDSVCLENSVYVIGQLCP